MVRIGIIRETKDPPDRRAPLDPAQCRRLLDTVPGMDIVVQPSTIRCFSDNEYAAAGIRLSEDLSDRDVLFGVKEVRLDALLPEKTYFFFSHTAKEQPYNRGLLQEVVRRSIRLIDYEYLARDGQRVVAFGRWAGLVGAYNGLRGYGMKTGAYNLKPAHDCFDLAELLEQLERVEPGTVRITVTGGGRVAGGALEILRAAGIREVSPDAFLHEEFTGAVFTRLDPWHYTRRSDGADFDFDHFVANPEAYESSFDPFGERTQLFIPCHYWDPRSPLMVKREHLRSGQFPISMVADISCDIGEPVASTLRASTIADPFYGYDPETGAETDAFADGAVTVMAVDNLPGELPRDAASDFGKAMVEHVIPEITGQRDTGMLERACIAEAGSLTPRYAYLESYLKGK
jgi:saccharopine dehydrogenase (NAD+, L-lysine-forming)